MVNPFAKIVSRKSGSSSWESTTCAHPSQHTHVLKTDKIKMASLMTTDYNKNTISIWEGWVLPCGSPTLSAKNLTSCALANLMNSASVTSPSLSVSASANSLFSVSVEMSGNACRAHMFVRIELLKTPDGTPDATLPPMQLYARCLDHDQRGRL